MIQRVASGRILIAGLAVLTVAGLSALTAGEPAQTGKKKAVAPHAVIAGTVFRDPGLAQAGAAVCSFGQEDP